MNNKFDELTKSIAQSVTRRAALKKFGVGLAGMALACFGLANRANADPRAGHRACFNKCVKEILFGCYVVGTGVESSAKKANSIFIVTFFEFSSAVVLGLGEETSADCADYADRKE